MAAEEETLYAVPDAIIFRNCAVLGGPQTRNLLLRNNTDAPVQAVVSYPFSPTFRISLPGTGGDVQQQQGQLKPNPPHALLSVPPNGTAKVGDIWFDCVTRCTSLSYIKHMFCWLECGTCMDPTVRSP